MVTTIIFNKPFGVLSQFTDASTAALPQKSLSGYIDIPNIYAAGRLDKDSEGLLVLTDDGKLQHKISDPKHKITKCYYVQVEGVPSAESIQALRDGVVLKDGITAPAKVRLVSEPDWLWPRNPAVRYRKTVPDSWLEIVISEGRNRQVRRMTATVGHPTLRLIRYRVGPWTLDGLRCGEWRTVK